MAKNRLKQREHLRCGMTKEERLLKESGEQINTRVREEKLDLRDYCGIKNPTAYEAVKNIIRKEQRTMSELYPQGAW